MNTETLELQGFNFKELTTPAGLARLDDAFLAELQENHPDLHQQLIAYRQQSERSPIETSELLIACAKPLENFIATLFDIEEQLAISKVKTTEHNPISAFKQYFNLRRARKELRKVDTFDSYENLTRWLNEQLTSSCLTSNDKELATALLASEFLSDPEKHKDNIEKLVQWCTRAMSTPEGQADTADWVSFRLPTRIDHQALVPTTDVVGDKCERVYANPSEWRYRDGFRLTDPRMSAREVQDEINYCIYCHDHEGDFCSKGFPVKKGDPEKGLKKNPLDLTMTGCPLEEKISEMHLLKRDGYTIAALAMIMIDNPMCPATGHRICNDCMKACIYQKQNPVDIPQIETRVLTDVLDLPWGVEVYDLLTRWNPLRQQQYLLKPYNGLKVLIAGMGPAGFTLAHHLLMEGFAIVGFDGLKIEPLPEALISKPVYRFDDLKESLDERLMAGFGGVAEYGITVRWDKNFLKLIYLTLMRRKHFQVFGGVRFGGTLTVEDAWGMGFDHFVIAVGAGLPKALSIPNSMAPGMRQANDFLMALQLGNAAKASSLTNLQIRLPAVVIGGGLTGVDTATEVQAYYITQVEKMLDRFEVLCEEYGEENVTAQLDHAARDILAEYIRHGRAVRKERERAKLTNQQPDFIKLVHEWGGVTIAYRRSMQESPAYINNHEELKKALEEGIYYLEAVEPTSVELNTYGHCETLICRKRIRNNDNEWASTQEEVRLPARSILVATGTQPNTAYEFEHRGTFNRLNLQYQHYEDNNHTLSIAQSIDHCKEPAFGPFTSYQNHDKRVSLVGDTHPVFHGNVVKAIASGMRTYPKILALFNSKLAHVGSESEYDNFAQRMQYQFTSRVQSITRLTSDAIELTVQAPLAIKHYQPGQFYRLQNFETLAPKLNHTLIQMEPLAIVPAEVNYEEHTATFIIPESSATAKLCSTLKTNEPVSLMGPTGVRARTPEQGETILIIGNKHSFAFVRSYGKAMRAAGNIVIYIAKLDNVTDLYCQKELENCANSILWLTKDGSKPQDIRSCDSVMAGADPIAALPKVNSTLHDVDRVYLLGDTNLLREFQAKRQALVQSCLTKHPQVIGSVYGNMQCMLKGVCAQCLQWQINPETGERTKAVFACSWQDQPLEIIDIDHIDARRMQNVVHEQFNNLWVDHLFNHYHIERV